MPSPEGEISAADREAILASARDYIESWLEGDPDRMARCLHPDLAKREVEQSGDGCTVDTMSRDDMVASAGRGPRAYDRGYDLSILDAYGGIATVRVLSAVFMDYLHVARCGDRWLLLNVLWQRRVGG